jgi:predicted small lipoprotein YifL
MIDRISVATPLSRLAERWRIAMLRWLALGLVCLVGVACGQKGPLTLPKGAASPASAPSATH